MKALEETQHLDFKPIFRKVYSEKLDRFRLQASIPVSGAAMGEIHEIVASTVGEANPNWAIKESSWNALKSLPGGKNQSVHRDFPTFETARALLKHKLVQGSVIAALMDNTRLHVYPRCFGGHADNGKRKTVNLKNRVQCYSSVVILHMLEQSTTVSTFDCTATYKLLG
eukprot:jgi/Phyca11/129937/e_gw1.89.120.1